MLPQVTIVIRDLAGPNALAATLAALDRHTAVPHEIVLVTPRADAPTHATHVRTLIAPESSGAPHALNRVLASTTAPYLVALESGAIVTADWLQRLLAALDDPQIGLCGPSTNIAWNEQQRFPRPSGIDWDTARIDACAAETAARYGDTCHPLDTLHSLGDFCYLFRRTLAEHLGGFDEAYGAGPCWEIDFSTRAARAGYRALWVAAAYVHRRPPTPSTAATLHRLFTANKHIYQDRFCGRRLRGEKTDYAAHCRGETCEHFAPPALIRLHLTRDDTHTAPPTERPAEPSASLPTQPPPSPLAPPAPPPRDIVTPKPTTTMPEPALISCIMPTRDRRAFIPQTIALFQAQDYPARELIILDDGNDRIADLLPDDPRIRYIALPQRASIGTKRNLACAAARGTLIAHWDDDDWYAPQRLSQQSAPLLANNADITGLTADCILELDTWRAWTCSAELHRRLFTGDVHGGTLLYRRHIWEHLARYPDISIAEDALFLRAALRHGKRLQQIPGRGLFVYMRHRSNAWNVTPGRSLDASGWRTLDPTQTLPPDALPFYQHLSPATPPTTPPAPIDTAEHPLVSCIMPTYNRHTYLPLAIAYFQRQDYPARELIILDDSEHPASDLIPHDPHIRYIHLNQRTILGAKRNLACELAHGNIIMHWDDDDWCAPHRISYQLQTLLTQRADLCGAERQIYYHPHHDRAWLYAYPASLRRWIAGNTLCYRKTFWQRNRFPEIAIGEDTRFIWSPQATRTAITPDHTYYIGLIHDTNTSRKNTTGAYWHPLASSEVHHLLGNDRAHYR